MNNLNSIIIEGNVVRNAELSEPMKGFKVCRFPVAVNRYTKNPNNGETMDEVSFFDVESYGKIAETCEKNLSKGRGVRVVGRLKQNRWKDDSGKNQSKIYIVAEHVEYKPKVVNDQKGENNDSKNQSSLEKANDKSFEQLEDVVF
ncbi:MAG: single-stranded DNA-binding protein [Treponema sp.]|nr:single-stranded DNA-binding protein [Treponema sp.]